MSFAILGMEKRNECNFLQESRDTKYKSFLFIVVKCRISLYLLELGIVLLSNQMEKFPTTWKCNASIFLKNPFSFISDEAEGNLKFPGMKSFLDGLRRVLLFSFLYWYI